jgi:hypothetical protein
VKATGRGAVVGVASAAMLSLTDASTGKTGLTVSVSDDSVVFVGNDPGVPQAASRIVHARMGKATLIGERDLCVGKAALYRSKA